MVVRFAFALLFAAAALAPGAPEKKPAEIEITDVSVHRDDQNVTIDGRLRNGGERPAKKLRVLLAFRSPEGKVIATGRGGVEGDDVDAGSDAEFHAQVPDPVRAVDIVFSFEDGSGRELKGINTGPFTIE